MKAIKLVSLIFLGVALYSCNPVSDGQAAVANSDLMIAIDGMVCEFGCARTIEEKVAGMNGIVKAEVNYEKKIAHIQYDNRVLNGLLISEEIEKMNEGQYSVKVLSDKSLPLKNKGEVENNSEDKASIKQYHFSFPQLLTYFTGSL